MSKPADLESLRKEYCPPLDEALFFALAHDFDIDDTSQVNELRNALDSLKEGAYDEQELELLPPDTIQPSGSQNLDPSNDKPTWAAPSSRTTEEDARASITTGISSLGISDANSQDHDVLLSSYGEAGEAFDNLSQDEKVHWLMGMFPSVPKATIEIVLAKCDNQFDRSTDELLNESFIKDSGLDAEEPNLPVIKGVEGFAASDLEGRRHKKGKGRSRRVKNRADHDANNDYHTDSAPTSGIATPDPNVWASAPRDIDFLTARTELSQKTIASIYHANGARLAPTIRAIVTKKAASYVHGKQQVDEVVQWQIDELKSYFENLPEDIIRAALMLTRRSPSAAKELLDVMVTSTEQPTILGKVDGLATYAPLDLSDGEPTPRRKAPGVDWSTTVVNGGHTLTHMANTHGLAAASAFNQASAAYKKGKSDRLMGGAAAYYASVGHDHVKAAKATQAVEADAHVARQSSSSTLDLHGVNVAHAVRIAKDATETWWENLEDRKYVPSGGYGGYRIVTGVGRHSADGIGRIGPAVSRMLVREGWKVEVEQGQIIVSGRVRKR